MLDILFIILLFFVFLIGINYNKEGFETQPDDLYQTEPIKSLTEKLNEYLQALNTSIGTMVSTISDNITSKANEKIDWIKGCAGCVKFCGTEPYWCSGSGCCKGPGYACNHRCTSKKFGVCTRTTHDTCYPDVDCWKTRDKCTGPLPKWNCSTNPSGFTAPSIPTGWTGVTSKNC